MYFLNLSLGQFLAVFGTMSAVMVALYLLDRARRRQVVSTLRFWNMAEQPPVVTRRKKIQQPLSLIIQLISMALLLLAIAQLRFGTPAGTPRDHVLLLETSAWMGARAGRGKTLMDVARERAIAYVKAVPTRDRIMLVRVDALATPATAFEPDRKKLQRAIYESQPGSTALNLDQAFAFARQAQAQGGRRGGEIALIGSGRIAERESPEQPVQAPKNLRFVPVADQAENCGLRKIGLRRSAVESDLWEIYVSARNYGTTPRPVTLVLGFGPSGSQAAVPVGTRQLVLPPGSEREAEFQFRTRAAGVLEAKLLPHDGFPDDDRAVLELPSQGLLRVTVYSDQPDLLRPALAANSRVTAVFRSPSEYQAGPQTKGGAELVILDRFRPPVRPQVDSIWIDPPAQGSPIGVKSRKTDVPFERWIPDHPLGLGLRTKDFRLDSTSVFETAPSDIRIGEVEGGPVIVAREGTPKVVVMGFHPGLSGMRYQLATPLLFANILRWMAPQVFRRWELSAGSVGTVKMALDKDVKPADLKVQQADGKPVPFTLHDQSLHFFAGNPGTVRVLAHDREYVYSLTLPQMWESRWEAPEGARHGVPPARVLSSDFTELWRWLAILGAAGLIAEWILYGRLRRGLARLVPSRPAGSGPAASKSYAASHAGEEVRRS